MDVEIVVVYFWRLILVLVMIGYVFVVEFCIVDVVYVVCVVGVMRVIVVSYVLVFGYFVGLVECVGVDIVIVFFGVDVCVVDVVVEWFCFV